MEIPKLKLVEWAVLFALALPLVGVPTLAIFYVDQPLFERLETSKLLLLAFSVSSPVFGIFFGITLIRWRLDPTNAAPTNKQHPALTPSQPDEELKNSAQIRAGVVVASMVTSSLFLAYLLDLLLLLYIHHIPLGNLQQAFIAPMTLGLAAGIALLSFIAFRAPKKT
jgi:hypothetical protein